MSDEPVFKTNSIALRVPAHIFDACVECGEPITGMAEVHYLAEMAWHQDCGPTSKARESLLSFIDVKLADLPE